MKSDNISFIKLGEEDAVLINLTNLIYIYVMCNCSTCI